MLETTGVSPFYATLSRYLRIEVHVIKLVAGLPATPVYKRLVRTEAD